MENLPSYNRSGKTEISKYEGEQISSTFTDHMIPKNTFDRDFTVKITKRGEWAMNRELFSAEIHDTHLVLNRMGDKE